MRQDPDTFNPIDSIEILRGPLAGEWTVRVGLAYSGDYRDSYFDSLSAALKTANHLALRYSLEIKVEIAQ